MAPFHCAHQSPMRKPSSPDDTEDNLRKTDEVETGGPSFDRKAMNFNSFRGHRRVSSGNVITSCKSVESTLREKGRSSSFRTMPIEKTPMENRKSLSSRTDKYSVAKIAASLFQSPGKTESSVPVSRLSLRTMPEQVISLRQQFQVAPEHQGEAGGDKERGCDNAVKGTEDNPIPLSKETCSTHGAGSVISKSFSGMGLDDPTLISQSQSSYMDASGVILSLGTSTAVSSLSSQQSSTESSFHLDPEGLLKLPLRTDSPEASMIDIEALLLATQKVTEAELTEAAVRSSIKEEDFLSDPTCIFDDSQLIDLPQSTSEIDVTKESQPAMRNEFADSKMSCHFDACLERTMSFESGSGPEQMKNFRMRRRGISASVHGAMLLKSVSESHSGPLAMKVLPKVGLAESISGEEALRAREFVLQKTAQISMGRVTATSRSQKSTPTECPELKSALRSDNDDCEELVQHWRDAHISVESKVASLVSDACSFRNMCLPCRLRLTYMRLKRCHEGFEGVSSCEIQKENYHDNNPGLHPDVIETGAKYTCIHEAITATGEVDSCSRERIHCESNPNFQDTTSDDTYKCTNTSQTKSTAHEEGSFGKSKRTTDRERISSEFDFLADGLSNSNSNSDPIRQAQPSMDANEAIIQTRSRSLVSSLHSAPLSETASGDTNHLGLSSGNNYANSSFSSSHQDRIWEEQADIYSSGGRGTPGRGFEPTTTNMFSHGALVFTASGSLRGGFIDPAGRDPPFIPFTVNRHHRRQQRGKKRGRPRVPLRSLLTDDVQRIGCGSRQPEGSHFIQQIMQKLRGNSSTSLSPKSPNGSTKRRNTWSSCVWFSIK